MGKNRQKSHVKASGPAAQAEVIRFLESGAGFGDSTQRIDTHGAIIFLTGDLALKIKRAVKYDYMDLSTVAKRHTLLDRELELNKSTAPSIYRSVMPIVRRKDGALALDGPGDVLEWVLVMNRFPAKAELAHIADDCGIDDALALKLGASIARYHAASPVRNLDGAALIEEIIDELERVFRSMGEAISVEASDFIARSRKVWSDLSESLHQRSRNGHIRRCHGDLHLRNIVVIGGVPTPFDALEFNERLGTCDTLYDLAFLLMDLDHRGMGHPANLVLNAYFSEACSDLTDSGLSLLPLYLSIRAAIRTMVDVQTAAVAADGIEMMGEARAYLMQAMDYLDPKPTVLLAIGGYSGSGKSTIARAIAHKIGAAPGALHIRSDVARKTLLHHDPLTHLGAEGYTPEVTARTYDAIRHQARIVLGQGHSVILDAVHGNADARRAAEDIATDAGCDFVGIWLESKTATRLARISTRGPDASDANSTVVIRQAGADPGAMQWHRIDTDRSLEETLSSVSMTLNPHKITDKQTLGESDVG